MNIYNFNADELRSLCDDSKVKTVAKAMPFWVMEHAAKLAEIGETHYEYTFSVAKTKWAAPFLELTNSQCEKACILFDNDLKERGFKNIKVEYCYKTSENSSDTIKVMFDW